jgi:hypothetical protein
MNSAVDADIGGLLQQELAELSVYAVPYHPGRPTRPRLTYGAIVVNDKARCGKQVILHESKYAVKHPLLSNADTESKAQEA